MSSIDSFPLLLDSVEEAPALFQAPLKEHLHEPAALVVYSPATRAVGRLSPASVLAVTASGWLVLLEEVEGQVSVHRADFAATLFLELTTILLYGALRIDYLAGAEARSVAVEFNTVRCELYEDAVHRLLDGCAGAGTSEVTREELDERLDALPLRFHNAALHYLPPNRKLRAVVHWPACMSGTLRWLSRELAPEATILLTDRELMLISEERDKAWFRLGRKTSRYGTIMTYVPLTRLGRCRLREEENDPLAVLEIEVRGDGAPGTSSAPADVVRVGLPQELRAEVSELLEQLARQLPPTARPAG